jgi:hypothetical protein
MASVTFSTGFHQIKPGIRVSGDEISVVYKSTYDSGLYAGKKYIHIDLTNEADLTFVEEGVSGPFDTVADVDALYQQLLDAGMTEVFEGFMVDPSDMSVISIEGQRLSFDFAGHQPYVFGRADDPAVTERVKVAHQTWTLPQVDFAGAATLFAGLEGPEELEFRSIEERFATQENDFDADILEVKGLLDDEIGARTNADAALQSAIDINTTGLATEINQRQAGDTATESAANAYTDTKINDLVNGAGPALDTLKELEDALTGNDSDIAALVTAVGNAQAAADANTTGLATEINQRQAGDNALSGRLDVLEADPITNAEVVTIANDLQANRIQGDAVLSADLSTEELARIAADNALDTRITAIEDAPYATDAGVTIVANDLRTDFENADTSETNARVAADGALDTRITALEGNSAVTDPVTKTYVDNQDALALPKAGAVVSTGSDVTFRYGDKLIIDSGVELNLWSDGAVKIVPEEDFDILLNTQASGRTKVSNGLEVTGNIDLTGNFTGSGTFSCGGLVVGDVGSFSSPGVPDNVTFAALVEAIGDALIARPKLDGSNIPGPYANDAAAATGGVAVGAIYKHDNGQIHYRVS